MIRNWESLLGRTADLGLRAMARKTSNTQTVFRPREGAMPPFDLTYVRTGPRAHTPIVIIPGGPGLASVLPYRALRRQMAADGLDVVMVEHRGVGLSRTDLEGDDLGQEAMWVDMVLSDIAAVLDQEGIQNAFVAGSSYGSYLAGCFAARYPRRVEGVLLDSALQSPDDIVFERSRIRSLFLQGDSKVSQLVNALIRQGEDQRILLDVVRAAYELVGMDMVVAATSARLHRESSPLWALLAAYATRDASMLGFPGYFEFARAGTIGFRELNYGAALDGEPLDPALTYSRVAHLFPTFEGEPYDLVAWAENFDKPLVVLMGSRDVRTPPAVAERTALLASRSVLVPITNGHSALDTFPLAFAKATKLLVSGQSERLLEVSAQLDNLPRGGDAAKLTTALRLLARREGVAG